MADLGFPNAEIQFDRHSQVVGTDADVLTLANNPEITDLVVIAHGWNDDIHGARQLFQNLAASLRTVVGSGAVPGIVDRRIAIVGVIWPSKKFADTALIPGGAAAAGSPISEQDILEQIEALRPVFPDSPAQQTLDSLAALVPELPDKATARAAFADQLLSLLTPTPVNPEDGPSDLFGTPGATLMQHLSIPVSLAPPQPAQGSPDALGPTGALGPAPDPASPTIGHAAGLFELLGGALGAARNLLNYTTFYEMKTRSGTIGAQGLAPLITKFAPRPGLRVHLVGHSFGARLVSAAALPLPPDSLKLATLTLLQAAFSHYGFSNDWDLNQSGDQPGYFRADITGEKVTGPILITHTVNDLAVGIAYAIASRLANQVAQAVGDANDIYGGMGRNGAQKTPEAIAAQLLPVGGDYTWQPRKLHNLLADHYIASHSDVTGQQVAYALLDAIATT